MCCYTRVSSIFVREVPLQVEARGRCLIDLFQDQTVEAQLLLQQGSEVLLHDQVWRPFDRVNDRATFCQRPRRWPH
jgi:hypothetical protein